MASRSTYTDGEVIAAKSGGQHAGSPCRTILTGEYDAARLNVANPKRDRCHSPSPFPI